LRATAFISSESAGRLAALVLRAAIVTLRLPCLAILVILEPVAKLLLAGSALLLAVTALFFALLRPLHPFPVWGMLEVAAGAVFVLALYYALLRWLSL